MPTFPLKTTMLPYEDALYAIGKDLNMAHIIITSSERINNFFHNRAILDRKKKRFLIVLMGYTTYPMESLLDLLSRRSQIFLLSKICEQYNELLLEFKKTARVKLCVGTSVGKRKKKLKRELLERLKSIADSQIILSISFSPKLMGGILIEYNSHIIDVSLLNELSAFLS